MYTLCWKTEGGHVHALTYTARAVHAQGLDSCRAGIKFCLTDFFALPTRGGMTQKPGDNLTSQQSATSTMWPVSRLQYGALR